MRATPGVMRVRSYTPSGYKELRAWHVPSD